MEPHTFQLQTSKFFPKKICSEKFFYVFSKEGFSYISRNGNKSTRRKFLILQEMETLKKFLIFQETETPKKLFIFRR